jgi:hypothetical protein
MLIRSSNGLISAVTGSKSRRPGSNPELVGWLGVIRRCGVCFSWTVGPVGKGMNIFSRIRNGEEKDETLQITGPPSKVDLTIKNESQ